jgi:hypothetical protein
MQVDFTQEEAQATIQLIDLAVKSGGLQVAQAGVVISAKLQEAFKPKEEEKPEPKEVVSKK